MLKKCLFLSSIILSIFFINLYGITKTSYAGIHEDNNFTELTCENQNEIYQKFIINLLFDPIKNSIDNIYGKGNRQPWKFEIISLEKGNTKTDYIYQIIIKFETFYQAHSAPFDTNIVKYNINSFNPLTIEEVEYNHYLINE